MRASKRGIWQLWMFKDGKEHLVHTIENIGSLGYGTNDCNGDVLFDYMNEHGVIESWDEYETDGDSESVAIMHKTGTKPDYRWSFEQELKS